jgi:hypothetical protein
MVTVSDTDGASVNRRRYPMDRRTYHRYRNLECENPSHGVCFGVDDMTYEAIAKHVAGRRGGADSHPVDCTCWMHAILREGVRRGEWLDHNDGESERRLMTDLAELERRLATLGHFERFGHRYLFVLSGLYAIGRDAALSVVRDHGSEVASDEWAASEVGKTAAYDHVVLEAVRKLCPELSVMTLQTLWVTRPFYALARLHEEDVDLPFIPIGEDAEFSVRTVWEAVRCVLNAAFVIRAEKMRQLDLEER